MTWRRVMTATVIHPVTWLVVIFLFSTYKEASLGRVFSPADILVGFQPWATR